MSSSYLVLENFIGGKFVPCKSHIDSYDPSTGEVYCKVPDSGKEEVEAAVAAAKAAFPAWSERSPEERGKVLNKLADLMEAKLEEFAKAESKDQGKTVTFARGDVPFAVSKLRFFASSVLHHTTDCTQMDHTGTLHFTLRSPVGVAGLISPWNFPLFIITDKIAPAIATGNTVVAKPSEMTSVTAWMMCKLMEEAGVPPGVVNIVFGTGPKAGSALVSHPDVPVISFTGSTVTARHITEQSAPYCKKLSLELGGKNPALVFADADLDQCVEGTIRSSFFNQGEVCLCTSRIYVERSIYPQFLEKFVAAAKKWKTGDPSDPSNLNGALISKEHMEKVKNYIALAKTDGGTIHCGEGVDKLDLPQHNAKGYFIPPTVITGVPDSSRVMQEEIFGPVTCINPFDTEDEAVSRGNGVRYGLGATVWSRDVGKVHRVAKRIQSGMVWTNCWAESDPKMPFGGVKHSGVGREGGKDSLHFFTEKSKNRCIVHIINKSERHTFAATVAIIFDTLAVKYVMLAEPLGPETPSAAVCDSSLTLLSLETTMSSSYLVLENFIGGKFVPCQSHNNSYDPSIGEVYCKVPDSGKEEVEAAVAAAKAAFPAWSERSPEERGKVLNKLADLMEAKLEEFAQAESRDQGKTLTVARRDISISVHSLRFFASSVLHHTTDCSQMDHMGALHFTLRSPVGVAGLITPWNFPIFMITGKIAPAIATGNTVVAKPSEMTSVTAWMMCKLLNEAGVPPGVVNVVFGTGPKTGSALVSHSEVPLISFTGSTVTARHITEQSAPYCKKLSFELGGKNPAIVFADADLDQCVETTIRSSFYNQGEVCLCTSRIYVERSIYPQFLEKFVAAAKKWKTGDPSDSSNLNGALISKEHMEKVKNYIALAKTDGGTIHCGEGIDKLDLPQRNAKGYFIPPTVITGVPDSSRAMQEEIFGPVTCINPFDTEDEAISRGNGVRYGLGATVWSQDVGKVHRVAKRLQSGMVWTNCWAMRDLNLPFGGMKHSGVGREGGKDSFDFFTEVKTVTIKH
ncbi:uncharacterized protein V6R79_003023 [Siganus canaliculatus]